MKDYDKKNIKIQIRKQIKRNFPNWKSLNKKKKKSIIKKIMAEVKARYMKHELFEHTLEEVLNIEPIPEGIMTIDEMISFISIHSNNLISFIAKQKKATLSQEIQVIDSLIIDEVINKLLSPEGYTPSKRKKTMAMLFRAELLKSLYYAEMSYRKFCEQEINDLERKKNRIFIGLSLRKKEQIDHSELSVFRSYLNWKQQLNLMVYFLSHFMQSSLLGEQFYFGIDGTDLAAKINTHPLATLSIKIDGKNEKISIYNQLDVDCGKRRTKSDKSDYYVGYKIHTLSAINPKTGMAYPLLSLLVRADHHDNNFLKPILSLGKAIGLDLKLVVVDEGYDTTDVEFIEKDNIRIIASPRCRVNLPENVKLTNGQSFVFCHDYCETPMVYDGLYGSEHNYSCASEQGKCPFELSCPKSRSINLDNGHFGPIPTTIKFVSEVTDSRRVVERPFNYLKNRNGLNRITVKSQQSVQVVQTIATIAILLIEIAGFRKQNKKTYNQYELCLCG